MCANCSMKIDEQKSNEFAERMLGILNQGALGLMMSIGYRTSLFDVMETLAPSTSHEIAAAANLNERYVREWLGAMVTGNIVHYDAEAKTYHLPAEHSLFLTRRNAPNNIAVTTQWLPLMAQVEDRVVESFRQGGGLAYHEYKRFNEVMADESHQTVVTPLMEELLPLVPGLREKLEQGVQVLDVGCGSGKALLALAQAFPQSSFVGYDFLESAVEAARDEAIKRGLKNVSFQQKDAARFDDENKYDVIFTFDAVHDQARPDKMLQNIFRALKSDGVYFCQEIAGSSHVENNMDHPVAPFMYSISTTHCMSVSLGQGGTGLGSMWGRELAAAMMHEAGFSSVEIRELEHDFINYYIILKK